MAIEPSGIGQQILEWASWLVAALAGLLYKQGRDEASRDRETYTDQLTMFREALGKTITREDFEAHEKREDKHQDERRQAESAIRDQVQAMEFERRQAESGLREHIQSLASNVDTKLSNIDTKLDGKLTSIMDNMLKISDRRRLPRDGE